jgi:hypothetical protein
MSRKSLLWSGAAASALFALCLGGAAEAKTIRKPAAPAASAADLAALKAEVDDLKARLDAQAAINARQAGELQAAQSDLAAAKAQAAQAAQTSQAAQQQVLQIPAQVQTQVKTEVAAARPKTDKIHYKGVTITLGGFAAAEAVYRSHDETADIGSSYSKMPFPNDRAGRTGSTTLTGRQSRYTMLIQGNPNPDTVVGFYGEFDFLGAAQTANANESNSYQPRVRNLYAQVDWIRSGWHLLAGQNWSLATLNTGGITPRGEAPPPTIEAQYVPGFVWARQPQLRVTKDWNKQFWLAVSAENPQTTFGNTAVASGVTVTTNQAPTSQFFNGTNYSTNNIPDIVAKAALEQNLGGHQLHAELFGIYRSYLDRVTVAPATGNQAALLGYAAGPSNQTSTGGGVGGSIALTVAPKLLDVQGSVMTGTGIGRYGSAQLPDVTARPDGRLQGIPETMWLAGATLHATPLLDVYLFGGEESEKGKIYQPAGLPANVAFGYGTLPGSNNAGCIVEGGSCSALAKSVDQVTVGLWDKIYQGPFGSVRFGLQYSYTEKKAFADAAGFAPKADENMLFTSFRYYPF